MAPFVVTAGSRALLVGSAAGVGPVRAELEAGGAAVDVLAPAALSGLTAVDAYATAVIVVDAGAAPCGHDTGLPAVLKSLTKGGSLVQLLPPGADAGAAQLELTLSGFVDVKAGGAPVSVGGGSYTEVTAAKPAWEAGAAAKVVLKKRAPAAAASGSDAGIVVTGPAGAGGKAWLAGAASSAGADSEMVDEDALLAADSLPAGAKGSSDGAGCAPKRRACKGCTCGRKEAEEAVDAATAAGGAPAPAAAPTSSCGNCWKGDAFRCATCPHLGKPAFKPGTDGAVMLDATDDI